MKENYFTGFDRENDLCVLQSMCSAIEKNQMFCICNAAATKFRFCVAGENGYPYNYTWNLIRWGFARKARNSDYDAQCDKLCPNNYISGTLSHFYHEAVKHGYFTPKEGARVSSGMNVTTLFI